MESARQKINKRYLNIRHADVQPFVGVHAEWCSLDFLRFKIFAIKDSQYKLGMCSVVMLTSQLIL